MRLIWEMTTYLVQHGEAYSEEEDPERRLTPKGRRETERIARYLYSINTSVEKIFHSPKRRAKETAEIIAKYLGGELVEDENLKPLDAPDKWVEKILDIDYDIMLVGHLPHLSRLASTLLNTSEDIIRFRYSSVLSLDREGRKWLVKWFITPEIIP